jgi:hypothetical protein
MSDIKSKNPTRPLIAIRLKCRECSNGILKEIRLCKSESCPLFNFRFGRLESRKGCGQPANLLRSPQLSSLSRNLESCRLN